MRLRQVYITLSLLTLLCTAQAQVTLTGRAPAYRGSELVCTRYADLMSFELEELGKTTIDQAGNFSFTLPIAQTTQIQLRCNGRQALMYADPGATYSIVLNVADSLQENAYRQNVRIDFDTLPIYDINNLVLDFNSRQDDFLFYNFTLFGKPQFNDRLDTFKLYLSKVYREVKHPYFLDYMAYSVGETEMLGKARKDENLFLKLEYATYLLNKPVRYDNDRYMNFFSKFYSDIFKMTPVNDEMELFRAVNYYASPYRVKQVLKKDILLRDDRLCELAMLRSLQQEYYNYEFDRDMILQALDSINLTSKYPEHKLIAKNVARRLTYLEAGSMAPAFQLADVRDSLVGMDDFKDKFIYIMFWSVDNTTSLNEMRLMKNMYEKYKWDVEFICINVDDDPRLMKEFLRKNSAYKWTFVHYGKNKKIRDRYNVTTLPQFFLVDPDRKLVQAPALRPSPNGTFKSIDETFYYINLKRHPRKKIMPGQKEN